MRWGRDLVWGLATAAVVIVLSQGISRWTLWGERVARELGSALGPLAVWECVWLALASGFAEEVFFRGLLQPRLGWLAASLLFGMAHLAPSRTMLPWTGFAIAAGGVLGGLFAMTGNLVAPVVAHAAINAVNLRWLSVRHGGATQAERGAISAAR